MHDFRISVVSVPVRDQEAAKNFYCDTLGFSVMRQEDVERDGRVWLQLAPPSGGASITLVDWFETMPPGSQRGVVMETGHIEESRAEMVRRGVDIDEIQEAPWGRWATFRDVDGNSWVLSERK